MTWVLLYLHHVIHLSPDFALKGTEIDVFSYKPTLLTSKTLEKIRPVFDYRCMVSGSEQKFLLGLGVSAKNCCALQQEVPLVNYATSAVTICF